MIRRNLVESLVSVFLLVSFICAAQAMWGQDTGVVVGRLADQQGAVVASAKVSLTNDDTGLVLHAVTDSSGFFYFYRVPVGHYSVKAESSGFKPVEERVYVSVANAVFIDLALAGGGREQPKQNNYVEIKIFYATDRRKSGEMAPASFYSMERSPDEAMNFGTCKVSIPRDHRKGELDSPKWWKLRFRQDPNRDVVLLSVLASSERKFFSELASDVNSTTEKKAFVFIHGYNVTFEDAARRTAQLAYDLTFQGVPIFYSWPSKGSVSGYIADEATIDWVRPHLEKFLEQVAARSNATSIYLIAHSMGNRALAGALKDIVTRGERQQASHFREVVLAAPDIDAGVFRQLATALAGSADRVTLYASSKDRALAASKTVHEYARAGESGPNLVVVNGIDTVDVSAIDTGFLGHSYVADNTSVITDMIGLIAGSPAPHRVCLSAKTFNGLGYWLYGPPGVSGCPVPLPNP